MMLGGLVDWWFHGTKGAAFRRINGPPTLIGFCVRSDWRGLLTLRKRTPPAIKLAIQSPQHVVFVAPVRSVDPEPV